MAVIHLVREGNDPEALKRFMDSYMQYSAGVSHRLVFLLKGFNGGVPSDIHELMMQVHHEKLNCPNYGYDLGSYFYAAERIHDTHLMFTNSHTVIQGEDWLAKMLNAYERPGVGMVGATGSWHSRSSQVLNQSVNTESSFKRLMFKGKALCFGLARQVLFPTFPNVHLRTNAFLIARSDFLAVRPLVMRSKLDAWLFESGYNSMTQRMIRRGANILVVARDGSVYSPDEWLSSKTFWQNDQENLLIQDNQTRAYQNGTEEQRAFRSWCAWKCHPTDWPSSKR